MNDEYEINDDDIEDMEFDDDDDIEDFYDDSFDDEDEFFSDWEEGCDLAGEDY